MASENNAAGYLTFADGSAGGSTELRMLTSNFQRSLNTSSSVRASSVSGSSLPPMGEDEKRGDLVMLYTLALAFVRTGAAKVLIDALRAAFSSFHSTNLRAVLKLNNTEIEITADNLSAGQLQDLIDRINRAMATP